MESHTREKEDTLEYIYRHTGENHQMRRARKAKERRMRKQYNKKFKQSDDWLKLRKLYDNSVELSRIAHTTCTQAMNLRVLFTPIESSLVYFLINLCVDNARRFNKELIKIFEIHKDKKGGCELEDFDIMFEIVEKYAVFADQWNCIVQPILDHLVDFIRVGELRMQDLSKLSIEQCQQLADHGLFPEAVELRKKAMEEAEKEHKEKLETPKQTQEEATHE